jgi:hypothetical protein
VLFFNFQKQIKMERWFLVCDSRILDTALATSYEEANKTFRNRNVYENWAESDIISEADYMSETQLSALEQSF